MSWKMDSLVADFVVPTGLGILFPPVPSAEALGEIRVAPAGLARLAVGCRIEGWCAAPKVGRIGQAVGRGSRVAATAWAREAITGRRTIHAKNAKARLMCSRARASAEMPNSSGDPSAGS